MAYGQTNVNAGVRAGEFLTSDLDFFTFVTTVPLFQTNVRTPLSVALKARNWSSLSASRTITVVDGAGNSNTYTSDADYTDALAKQSNLDLFLQVWATRANPVVVNVYSQSAADMDNVTFTGYSNATTFGTDMNKAGTIYTIKLMSEKSGAWFVGSQGNFSTTADDTNTYGYQFLAAINGIAITELATPVTDDSIFNTTNTGNGRNLLGVRDADLRRQINAS